MDILLALSCYHVSCKYFHVLSLVIDLESRGGDFLFGKLIPSLARLPMFILRV